MQLSDARCAQLNTILHEWNRAEEDIKTAEQICGKVVNPSIKELRYAGRRIVDALARIGAGDDGEEVDKLFADALFDCHRARHDAIDAGTSKIAADLEIMLEKLKHDVVLAVYPGFREIFVDLQEVRNKIVASRGDRENREAIYSVIEDSDFPALVRRFNDMRLSEGIMKSMATRNRVRDLVGWGGLIFGIVGAIVGVIGVYLSIH